MYDVSNYEAMAMLELENEKREQLSERFNAVVERFALLDDIPADGVEPLVTVLTLNNVLREDVSEKHLSRDDILKNAPEQYDGYFQVPGTLE